MSRLLRPRPSTGFLLFDPSKRDTTPLLLTPLDIFYSSLAHAFSFLAENDGCHSSKRNLSFPFKINFLSIDAAKIDRERAIEERKKEKENLSKANNARGSA